MDAPLIHSLWTILVFVIFIGIVVWVFLIKRRGDFDKAARIPLEDEPGENRPDGQGTSHHG